MDDPTRLELEERTFGPGDDPIRWRPFAANEKFRARWWDQKQYRRSWFVQALLANEEVARVRLNPDIDLIGYVGVPTARVPDLEIVFFEVAAGRQGQRIGTKVIHALAEQYPDRRLVAASKGVDGFWAGLGWTRCIHSTEPRFRPPVFVS